MAICPNDNGTLVGRYARLYLADGCPDTEPADDEWQLLGPMTSKGVDFSPNTVTSDADDTGGFVVSLVTNSDLTISGEGEVRARDKSDEYGIHRLIQMYVNEQKAMRQPTLWVRLVTGQTVITMYGVLTTLSYDAGTNDIITFSVSNSNSLGMRTAWLRPLRKTLTSLSSIMSMMNLRSCDMLEHITT